MIPPSHLLRFLQGMSICTIVRTQQVSQRCVLFLVQTLVDQLCTQLKLVWCKLACTRQAVDELVLLHSFDVRGMQDLYTAREQGKTQQMQVN